MQLMPAMRDVYDDSHAQLQQESDCKRLGSDAGELHIVRLLVLSGGSRFAERRRLFISFWRSSQSLYMLGSQKRWLGPATCCTTMQVRQ